jgi:hypothetical protein
VITRKQSLLEQIAVCEGVIERLKAQNPTPAPCSRLFGPFSLGSRAGWPALKPPT